MSKFNYSNSLRFSQNFLTSSSLIKRIVKLSSINKNDVVVEIGAGKGHITRELCRVCSKCIAIENDKVLYQNLTKQLCGFPNIQTFCSDFLKWRLPRTPYKVFANIPFNITTDIIRKLFLSVNSPEEAWLVVEKGAAKRFMGQPAESAISLLIKPRFETKIIYYFCKEDYHPKPTVDTVLLHFRKKQVPDIGPNDFYKYKNFITQSIHERNSGIYKFLTKKQIRTALKRSGLSVDITSRETLYIQWLCLFRCYLKFHM